MTPRRAFSLVELMIAMGIFVIGAVAVASIFPVAILLQKASIDSVNARAFAASAEALAIGRGFNESELLNTVPAPVVNEVFASPDTLVEWSSNDRGYNSSLPSNDRRVYWTALFMPTDLTVGAEKWMIYVFVMQRTADGKYLKTGNAADWASDFGDDTIPSVTYLVPFSASGTTISFDNTKPLIRVGDSIVAEINGVDSVCRVTGADDDSITIDGTVPATGITRIWYVDPGDTGQSAFVRLITLLSTDYPSLIR